MLLVVIIILAVDEDVIDVYDDAFVKQGMEDILDQGLEGGGSIGKAKGHDTVLEVAIMSVEHGLLNIILIAGMQVNLIGFLLVS